MTFQTQWELVKAAEKEQKKELSWISNLYQKRLKQLQETEVLRQAWLKEQQSQKAEQNL